MLDGPQKTFQSREENTTTFSNLKQLNVSNIGTIYSEIKDLLLVKYNPIDMNYFSCLVL
jgi:hypothetical protein